MELPAKKFKSLVSHLNAKGSPLGLSLSRRYADELVMDDTATVCFKDIADSRRILEATEDFTPAQKESAGVVELKAFDSDPLETRIPHTSPRAEQAFTSKRSPPTAISPVLPPPDGLDREGDDDDDDGCRFRRAQETGPRSLGDLINTNPLQAPTNLASAVSDEHRHQRINLDLPPSVEKRLRQRGSRPLASSAADERAATERIRHDAALDVDTARTFLCLFVELRGRDRVGLETRFMTPRQPVSSTRPTLLFRGEYVTKDSVSEDCKVILAPYLDAGRWSLITLDNESGVTGLHASALRKPLGCADAVKRHYDFLDSLTRIVKCAVEPDARAGGVFMLLNTVAYLDDLVARDFYGGSDVAGIRRWLAVVMEKKVIPVGYKF